MKANLQFLHLARKAFGLQAGTAEAKAWTDLVNNTYPLANKEWLLQIAAAL